ncbi:hypothetical protein BGZ49_002783 [Haplosporangium sp. Z 27]|nr:hypothetical protein BGZ49_002783 [Haplosporangium sp. Z 27]
MSSQRTREGILVHSPSEATIEEMNNENTPLLSGSSSSKSDPIALYVKTLDEHLPWYKRPSALWLIPIFGLTWISSGMLSSSLGQFQASVLCREYLNRHASNTTLMATNSKMIALRPAPECQAPEIQAFTAEILALVEVIVGIASTFSIGYYASLSDKHGRRIILILSYFSTLVTLCSIVLMGMYWDSIGLPLMIVAGLVNGLLGGTMLGITMMLAYAADCTDPAKRSLVYSWLHAGVYLGLSIGPYLGGVIARATNTILTIVYIDFTITVACLLFITFVVPESLPSKQSIQIRQIYDKIAKKDSSENQERVAWHSHASRSLGFFKPNGRNTNLILLAAISFLQMLSYRGTLSVIILYTNRMFKWTEYEDGIMFSLISFVRLVTVLVILPILVYFYQEAFKKKQNKSKTTMATASNNDEIGVQAIFNPNDLSAVHSVQSLGEAVRDLTLDHDDDEHSRLARQFSINSIASLSSNRTAVTRPSQSTNVNKNGVDTTDTNTMGAATRSKEQTFSDMKFDTWMVRLGLAINAITYVGYGLAREGRVFYLATALHALSIISSPSLKSLLTGLVEPSQFGAVLGAIQVVDSIGAIFSPIVISWVYALTVKSMPGFVWYSCAAWSAICVLLSFMIRQKEFRKNFV